MQQNPLEGVTLESFEQLESGLLNWRSFADDTVYDAAGMMALFCACLHNLDNYALLTELEDFSETLSQEERAFLNRLCSTD
ncbi:hypothetical protein CA54_07230 [Symmachiella macrocystis]|uniref:Uncharacterized protein n=2 Tax=Symmachiella macrocystis TaxID=2527985 RepID=A0A5C6BK35_9PLAN|nr:hypothetical protein CA54_07230 [Symmachiella macrocystis]